MEVEGKQKEVKEEEGAEEEDATPMEGVELEGKRQKKPHAECGLTWGVLDEKMGLGYDDDCPTCKDWGVLCRVRNHPATVPSSGTCC